MKALQIASILLLALSLGCSGDKQEKTAPEAAEKAELTAVQDGAACTVKMNVDGMACNVGCPPVVKKALMSVAGVSAVDVSFENSMATITASGDGCNDNGKTAMIEALKAKDYKASVEAPAEGKEKDPT